MAYIQENTNRTKFRAKPGINQRLQINKSNAKKEKKRKDNKVKQQRFKKPELYRAINVFLVLLWDYFHQN